MPGQRLEPKKDKRLLVLFGFGLLILALDYSHIHQSTGSGPTAAEQEKTERTGAALSPRRAFFLHQPMSINQATAQDLTLLPGVGEQLAGRIIAFRETNGGLDDSDDLEQVAGIGKKLSRKISGFVTFSQP